MLKCVWHAPQPHAGIGCAFHIQMRAFEYQGLDWMKASHWLCKIHIQKRWFVRRHVWTIAHFWCWMAATMNIHSKLDCCWRRLDHFEWEPNWSKKWPCSVGPPACPNLFKVCTHIHKCRFDLWSNKRFLSNISIIKHSCIYFSGHLLQQKHSRKLKVKKVRVVLLH